MGVKEEGDATQRRPAGEGLASLRVEASVRAAGRTSKE